MIHDCNKTVNKGYYFLTFTASRGCFKNYQEFITDHGCAVSDNLFQIAHIQPTGLTQTTTKGKVHPCTGTEALYTPYGP